MEIAQINATKKMTCPQKLKRVAKNNESTYTEVQLTKTHQAKNGYNDVIEAYYNIK